jgi:hypothetical protein
MRGRSVADVWQIFSMAQGEKRLDLQSIPRGHPKKWLCAAQKH